MDELERLLKRHDLRSADRAEMRNLLRKMRRRQQLTYQESLNLTAYLQRYNRPTGGQAG